MIIRKSNSNCLYCGDSFVGRSDKKFCDSQCRSSYHHENSKQENSFIKKVNKRLKQNRRILALFKEKGEVYCTAHQLLYSGFDFSIHTSISINKEGHLAYFCYDHGYISKDDEKLYLLQKSQDH